MRYDATWTDSEIQVFEGAALAPNLEHVEDCTALSATSQRSTDRPNSSVVSASNCLDSSLNSGGGMWWV